MTRLREDLDTGYIDFNNVLIGNNTAPLEMFENIINSYETHDGWDPIANPNDKTCVRFFSLYMRRTWPCEVDTCGDKLMYKKRKKQI